MKAVHEFWHQFQDKDVYRAIAFLEGVEDWTVDGDPEFETAIQELGTELDNIGTIEIEQEDNFIKLGAYIKSGRVLRILMAMDAANPGAASKILMQAEKKAKEKDQVANYFLARNVAFERMRLIGRIFSDKRLKLVQKALENHHE
jgi:intracellular multiplication protein IcmW